jgi:hypothetical protein
MEPRSSVDRGTETKKARRFLERTDGPTKERLCMITVNGGLASHKAIGATPDGDDVHPVDSVAAAEHRAAILNRLHRALSATGLHPRLHRDETITVGLGGEIVTIEISTFPLARRRATGVARV